MVHPPEHQSRARPPPGQSDSRHEGYFRAVGQDRAARQVLHRPGYRPQYRPGAAVDAPSPEDRRGGRRIGPGRHLCLGHEPQEASGHLAARPGGGRGHRDHQPDHPLPDARRAGTPFPQQRAQPEVRELPSLGRRRGGTVNQRTGRCECAHIAYDVAGIPDDPHLCSCSHERRISGGPAVLWVGFPLATLRWTGPGGEPAWYVSGALRRGFCPRCGSQLVSVADDSAMVMVTGFSLDDMSGTDPVGHSSRTEAPAWMTVTLAPEIGGD
ncbi:GFA family protein [Streptomyces vinaceus]|uniref:GFA family protein n=1 Tax=Streptomyces vinaceus TaxID=1960 RepID=UPI0035DFB31F